MNPHLGACAPRPSNAIRQVLVVGGRGFFGAAIARALRRDGLKVSCSGREPIPPLLLGEVDTLVWCAGGRGDEEHAQRHVHVEAPGAAMAALPRLRAMLYVSSGEVYGTQPAPFGEDAPRLGASPYARAKIAGEDAARQRCAQRGVALTIVRPAVLYGPGQAGAMLVPTALRRLAAGEFLAVTAGEQTRDWLYVDDAADAIRILVEREHTGVYNLGSGVEVTVRAMIEGIAAAVGSDALARVRWGALPHRPDEQRRYALCADRARTEFGWQATTALDEGLAACVRALDPAAAAPGEPAGEEPR